MMIEESQEKIGLVISVGTSPSPMIKVLEDARREQASYVYFLYGRSLEKQKNDPLDVLQSVREKAKELDFKIYSLEISNPENFNSALQVVKEVIEKVKDDNISKLICNFTGGTKPMSAALVHGFLTEPLSVEIYLDYMGGTHRGTDGRVPDEYMKSIRVETRSEKDLKEAVKLLRDYDYSHAYYLTRYFPEEGSLGFVKNLTEALFRWDIFDYKTSLNKFKKLINPARYMIDYELLIPLAKLIIRIVPELEKYLDSVKIISSVQDCRNSFDTFNENIFLIPAEALNNAERRLSRKEYTEVALRTYRAVETAVQIRLLMKKINPWKVNLDKQSKDDKKLVYCEFSPNELPKKVALNDGFKILKGLRIVNNYIVDDKLKALQQIRNDSYLEHGYKKVDEEQANQCYQDGIVIINAILEVDIKDYKSKLDLKISD